MDNFLRDASFIFLACLCIFCHLHPDHLKHTREKGTRLHFANSDGPGPVTHPCSRAVGYVSLPFAARMLHYPNIVLTRSDLTL